MVQAVLLPLYGSWFDRDFAGRRPDHDHIYLGEVDLNHHHANDNHRHEHDTKTSCIEQNDIIFLADDDTLGQGWAFVLPPSTLSHLGSDTPSFPLCDTLLSHLLLFIPPLEKPPQI